MASGFQDHQRLWASFSSARRRFGSRVCAENLGVPTALHCPVGPRGPSAVAASLCGGRFAGGPAGCPAGFGGGPRFGGGRGPGGGVGIPRQGGPTMPVHEWGRVPPTI